MKDLILKAIPKNWLDPLLTGPNKVIGPAPYNSIDIENVLGGVRDRISKMPLNKAVEHSQPKQCKPFDYCDKRKENCCGSWCPDYPAAG